MALLFTVVLSACPSRIRRSHNPLFIPTEAPSVCKWTWVMADKERLTSPPIQAGHAASNTHRNTHTHTSEHTHLFSHTCNEKHKCKQQRKKQSKWRKVFIFFPGYYHFLFLFSLRFYVMSPCKKALWSFQASWP